MNARASYSFALRDSSTASVTTVFSESSVSSVVIAFLTAEDAEVTELGARLVAVLSALRRAALLLHVEFHSVEDALQPKVE